MNSKQLRQSLKVKWLVYYRDNRDWIDKLGIWSTYDGQRRPSSGFILATLAALEPNLTNLLPLVVDLTSNPDRIVAALGLNVSPAVALKAIEDAKKMLPSSPLPAVDAAPSANEPVAQESATAQPAVPQVASPASVTTDTVVRPVYHDDDCTGVGGREDDRPRR